MTELSAESVLELGKPFKKELGKAVEELSSLLGSLVKRTEELQDQKNPQKPTQLFNAFFSQNLARLQRVVNVVRRQASKNEDLAKQAIEATLIDEWRIPPEAARVVGANLVTAALASSRTGATSSFKDTLEKTNLSDQERREAINFVKQTGREMVPTPEVTDTESEVVEEEAPPEEVEYTPPGGPPTRPPRGPRRRGRDGGRDRTRAEALRRRGRLPWAAGIFGAAVLGLSLITGQGKPWEGYPIQWGFDVAGLAGGGAKEGSARLGRGAVGARTEGEISKDITSKDIQRVFSGEKTVERFLESYIRGRGREENLTKPKNYDIVFNPAKLNSAMKLDMELLGNFIREQNMTSDEISEKLVAAGQSKTASEILEDFLKSHITGQPILPERAEEIINWWEKEIGLEWKRGR